MTEPEAFFRLYESCRGRGPAAMPVTREALRRLPPLPAQPRVLDLGCGAGRQTLVLAEALGTRVVAVDLHRPFLDQLEGAARGRGLADRVETRCADMGSLELPPGSVDLLWSEGAIYLLGFEDGLRRFRPCLAPGGLAAISECSWLGAARPDEAAAFWRAAYPALADVAENAARAARAGFEVLDWFALPGSAWWDDYYTPLAQRIRELAPGADRELAAIIAETEREIDLYRRYAEVYGYVFYLMRARA